MKKIRREELFDGQVIRLILNAPKANVLDGEMMAELQSELENISKDVKLLQFFYNAQLLPHPHCCRSLHRQGD